MKKVAVCILCILVFLSGCNSMSQYEKPVQFYYCNAENDFGNGSASILSETREGAGLATLEETLVLYLAGPESDSLVSPFPDGLKLVRLRLEENTLFITLNDRLATLSNLDLTLACSCITMTCLDLTEAEQVTIDAENALLAGQKTITMDRNTLLLLDTATERE